MRHKLNLNFRGVEYTVYFTASPDKIESPEAKCSVCGKENATRDFMGTEIELEEALKSDTGENVTNRSLLSKLTSQVIMKRGNEILCSSCLAKSLIDLAESV